MEILYFAWIREKIGTNSETILLPDNISKVQDLLLWLQASSDKHASALKDLSIIKVAVNQEYAKLDDPISNDDEVALFPPVTGG